MPAVGFETIGEKAITGFLATRQKKEEREKEKKKYKMKKERKYYVLAQHKESGVFAWMRHWFACFAQLNGCAILFSDLTILLNPYKPCFLFMGHRHTEKSQLGRRKTRPHIWDYSFAYRNFIEKNK